MITTLLPELPPISPAERTRILTAPRTAKSHRTILTDVPAMNAVQLGGAAESETLSADVTVAAWNVERCLFPAETADHLSLIAPQIVLLSEVDHGMARTSQRHTTAEIAERLGMQYAFGVEFHELDLGGPTERAFCTDDFNALGWHGNAILSSVPFEQVAMIRLDDHGHWFADESGASDPDQPRLGGRMAIIAVVPGETGPLCVVSTHLESNASADHRHLQFSKLLDAIDQFSPNMPVLIGGDLNTGNHLPPDFDWRRESLFNLAEQRGYSWDFNADGPTTRPSLITPHPDRVMKLDWFAGRDMQCSRMGIMDSVGDGQRPLSDHDCVWCFVNTG